MKQKISLDEYLRLGGDLSKLDTENTFTDYYDFNKSKPILSVEVGRLVSVSFENPNGVQLYTVKYLDGSSKDYASFWIKTAVEFCLSERYLK